MNERNQLLQADDTGLHCRAGGFHVDPWRPADVAVVTHGHSDHARPGSKLYWAPEASLPILRSRLAADLEGGAEIRGVPYGETFRLGDAAISFHPAGHVLGSAQVRVEVDGEVWVVSGDYKRIPDPTCEPFEVVECDAFVTEATFALPVYRWPDPQGVAREILAWWDALRTEGRNAVLFCYSLGKCQRLLAELATLTDRRVFLHGALVAMTDVYRDAGVEMLPTTYVTDHLDEGGDFAGDLILAPPSSRGTSWIRRFGRAGTAFASGWMTLRGTRRQRSVDRGFVLSDHADWPNLLRTIEETRARRVLTTHGYADTLARFLREERGLDAEPLETRYRGEDGGDDE